MILQALDRLYDRLATDPGYGIAQPGYSTQKIAFVIVLHPDGQLFDIEDVREQKGAKRVPRSVLVPGQSKPTGSGINPCFLWDNSAYLLGHVGPGKPGESDEELAKRSDRVARSFAALRDEHLLHEPQIQDQGYSAVCRFLAQWQPDRAAEFPWLDELVGGFGVFKLIAETEYVHDRPAVRAWWTQQQQERPGDEASGICMVTGTHAAVARTHEPKLKGVTGAQSSGALLVSFNCEAFTSYGKDQSQNAPVSEQVAFRYCTALNGILSGPESPKHRIGIGDTTVVFWTERPTQTEDWLAALLTGDLEQAQDSGALTNTQLLLQVLRHGGGDLQAIGDDPQTPVYVLGLAPNAARLSVRFWHVGALGDLLDKLHAHHAALRMVRASDTKRPDPEFPAVWMLLRETARESKDIPPLLGGALMRAILEGTPYPDALANAVIRRIRADRVVNYLRAAMLKAWLIRKRQPQGEISVSLDTERTEPSYRLGRLFAVLESAQYRALGDVGANIRDRFYSAASATPSMVFPRLLRTYQHHLGKMDKGAKTAFEKRAQEIIDGIDTMPAHLNLEAQAEFAIGYYHQRKALFDGAKRTEAQNHNKE